MPYAAKKKKPSQQSDHSGQADSFTDGHDGEKTVGSKKQLVLKIFFVFVIVFCLLIVLGVAYMLNITKELNYNELDTGNLGLTGTKNDLIVDNEEDDSITNIALFGVDRREGDNSARSDVVMVVSVDKRHNKIKLSSIMRDTLVPIEGHNQRKLNSAYNYGGAQLAVKTLNQITGLNITEYATADFSQMAEMIEAVGGVEIDVTESERLQANISIKEQSRMAGLPEDYIKKAGLQTLSGTQAVAFARIRHTKTSEGQTDDFGRTDRQREVMGKMFDKVKNMSVLEYPALAKKFLPMIETSLDMNDLVGLAGIMLRDVTFVEARFPTSGDLIGNGSITVNGESCLNVDLEGMKNRLQAFIYLDIDPNGETSSTASSSSQ